MSTTAKATAKPQAAGAKVVVASKMPMALLLQLCKFQDVRLPDGRGGYFTEKNAVKVGPVVRINGTAYPRGEPPEGFRDRPEMVAGCALTRGVDKEWWDKWVEQNAEAPYVKSGLLFAFEKTEAVRAQARERADLDSGLGPIVPARDGVIQDPRMPRPIKGIELRGEAGPTDLDTAA